MAIKPIVVLLVGLALASLAEAQKPKKVPRIGYLSPFDPSGEPARSEPIRRALRELGYIDDGQNIAIEYRYAENKQDRYPELVAELVGLKVDIIVVSGGATVVRAAKNATKTIPIGSEASGLQPESTFSKLFRATLRNGFWQS